MNKKQEIINFIKFNIVGVMNTLIDFIVYGVLRQKIGIIYPVAAGIGYSCGLINSYIWNKNWTFKNKEKDYKQLVRFIVVNLIAFSVSLGILTIFEKIGFNKGTYQVLGVKGVSTVISLIINFIGSKLWVFK